MNKQTRYGIIGTAIAAALGGAPVADADPQLRGRIHLDYALYNSDVTPLNDGFRVRRARLGASGKFDDIWSYTSEVDFAENGVDFKDMYLRHNDIAGGRLTIGQQKVPFSLEELTSSNNITFMERASPNLFSLSRRIGAQWYRAGERSTFAVMGFGQAIGAGDGGDEGLGIGARFTFAPIKTDTSVLHLGIAGNTYEPTNSNNEVMRFRQRPESRNDGTRLVDTGNLADVDNATALGIEAAWVSGPLSIQGEYMTTTASRTAGDVTMNGYYVYGSWFLTGENRRYSNGVFSGPRIANAERGAWEVGVRYSNLDLVDTGIDGGEMKNATFGVNWYPRSNVRFMFNYITVDTVRAGVSDDPSIVMFRTQVSF
ncbi:MAG: OprO/OprP family phosphate-selective porin [Gammaproteobacteria bacterium]